MRPGDYENIAAPLPEISPAWSPVARFGGFQTEAGDRRSVVSESGVRQARAFVEAAADSEEQRAWRDRRGDLDRVPRQLNGTLDPLDGCY
ncbi:hypothetical protein [Streptomyces sp. NPDC088794]|uniref:hypothetical protein n=1 Tax=Streptomyces sp. NPDC088794 TaxID=3365902 RepID=UPI0038187284